MKHIKKSLLSLLLLVPLLVSMADVAQAVEMEVDVGIEFTDIEPEPKPDPKPVPEPPKPPIKKVIQLPQTGEKKSQSFTFAGTILMVSAGVYSLKRKKEVTKQ